MTSRKNSISRRSLLKKSLIGATALASAPTPRLLAAQKESHLIRLGGPVFRKTDGPDDWAGAVKKLGYSAAYCPVGAAATDEIVRAYAQAARKADITIAEVGAWSNPISPDDATRQEALAKCKDSLALADRIGARCCVNIAGSRGETWAGPCEHDLTDETFGIVVETVRDIIDSVEPQRTFYTLEAMPWMYPDSADSYLRLIEAVDRTALAVHLDPVNIINCPERYFRNADLIRDCFQRLGPYIKSCHAKDVLLRGKLTVHLDEVRPGAGNLDYGTYVRELAALDGDVPLILEHLPSEDEYTLAAEYLRAVARDEGLSF